MSSGLLKLKLVYLKLIYDDPDLLHFYWILIFHIYLYGAFVRLTKLDDSVLQKVAKIVNQVQLSCNPTGVLSSYRIDDSRTSSQFMWNIEIWWANCIQKGVRHPLVITDKDLLGWLWHNSTLACQINRLADQSLLCSQRPTYRGRQSFSRGSPSYGYYPLCVYSVGYYAPNYPQVASHHATNSVTRQHSNLSNNDRSSHLVGTLMSHRRPLLCPTSWVEASIWFSDFLNLNYCTGSTNSKRN